jgi:hypothetical protein
MACRTCSKKAEALSSSTILLSLYFFELITTTSDLTGKK